MEYYGCAVGKETIVTSVPRHIAIEYQFVDIILIIVIYVLIPIETAINVDVSWPLITTPHLENRTKIYWQRTCLVLAIKCVVQTAWVESKTLKEQKL